MYCFSSLAEFALLRDSIKKELMQNFGDDALHLFVAINEGVNNAILHGNKENTRKKVYLSMERVSNEMEITIRDEGSGFLEGSVADSTEIWREDGRGLELMKHCVDSYRLNDLGNEITLIKRMNTSSL